MKNEFKTVPGFIVYLFFIIGVISAIAFRLTIFFQRNDPVWARILWYIAVIGYVFFFLYRWWISHRRKRIVKKYRLIQKLEKFEKLEGKDREALLYIIKSIEKSKENYNYYIIFILSIGAILLDIILHYL